ncbi:membrane protein insertase YidC [Alteromonas aestuariivivens]|uniref:Membrane protein insertase YidC n=1 Tax=Alteromonas aestuariivivens TaxID=1938339 RepID=A0A3D8M5H1_9ALTE|nr:membrane protein insertase YidC [Alteromonas aestuariivivens]RDV24785.1 membrane protein insertase YidC [Alteromonas aestuariivivens]
MESQRSFLIIGLALVSFLLWQQWHVDYGPKPVAQEQTPSQAQATNSQNAGVPSTVPAQADTLNPENTSSDVPVSDQAQPVTDQISSQSRWIRVVTDTLDVQIDLVGGDVVSADLMDFPVTQGSDVPYSLLRPQDGLYVAQSGLVGANGPDGNPAGRPRYNTDATEYELSGDSLEIPLSWQSANGIQITKTFTFFRGRHDVDVSYHILNQSGQLASFQQYAQLKQVTDQEDGNMFMPTYRGAAYSTQDERYEKYTFDDIEDNNLRETTTGGWVGMLEHYFVSAWIPPQEQTNTLYSLLIQNQYAIIGYKGSPVTVADNETQTITSQLYMGPKDQETLAGLARGLDLTVDYGVLWWISQPLFSLLKFLHSLVGNWGVAIILITIVVKGAMYWLTKKQYESMARLRSLAPKMQQLKDRFGEDRQKMSQAMMELYRKEKVNPMGGCLPLLLQMPIFLALYWVLLESVELRHAEFFLWITDLSVKDPFFVLPVLTGGSMYLLQKLQPTTVTDPMQQKIMQWMPVMMSVFFLWFPAGLVLYWLVSNVITLVQAKMIYASMEKRGIKTH